MAHKPTQEQEAILEAGVSTKDSLMIEAGAGCAKTTTLTMLAKALPPSTPGISLAFNVKIKDELAKVLPKNFEVLTLNGLGHRAWSKAIASRLTLDDKKIGKLVTQLASDIGLPLIDDMWGETLQLVKLARNSGLVPRQFPHKGLLDDTQDTWQDLADDAFAQPAVIPLAQAVLRESVKLAFRGTIDFDDQIYMSAIYNGVFPRTPLLMTDETQDLSPLNHIQVKRTALDRIIAVGDPRQAIYAFRGADSESMSNLRKLRSYWKDLPLLLTFRCPKAIVRRQQEHAPGFRAAPSNEEGLYSSWVPEFKDRGKPEFNWDFKKVPYGNIAMLCRNNAPLLSMAFKLLRQHIGVRIIGGDIGRNLISLAKKIIVPLDSKAKECHDLIEAWKELESLNAEAKGKREKIAGIVDRADCLLAVLESPDVRNGEDLIEALSRLFARNSGLVELATGHRAKGLEWDIVLHLDPFRIPSKFAKKAAEEGHYKQLIQENNLKYVIETRTKNTLIDANAEDFV